MIGKVTARKVDNGWILDWWESGECKCEVFDNPDTFLTRVGHLTESVATNEFLEKFHYRDDSGHFAEYDLAPGTPDALVAELTAPGTPPTTRGDE